MLTGLALTAVFWLNVVAYTTLNTASLLNSSEFAPGASHGIGRRGASG